MKILKDSYAWMKNPFAFLDQAQRTHGLTFRQRLIAPGKCLITGDHRLIEQIRSHPDLEAGKTIRGLRTILGDDSLIMLHGEEHRIRRDTITPFFRGNYVTEKDERVLQISSEEFTAVRGVFSAFDLFQRISLRTILLHLFGNLARAQERKLMDSVIAFLSSFHNPLILFARPLQVDLGRRSPWGRAIANRAHLLACLDELLAERPQSTAGQIALAMKAEGASPNAVKNEILALLLFGHDTGAAVLSWAAAHCCARPRVMQCIRESTEEPGTLLLRAEGFVHACILETMRITPAVVHLTRRCETKVSIGSWTIEPGTALLPCIYLAQRDPRIFEQPEEFQPERFLGAGFSPASYFPFGFGNRLCVGMPFVLRQMQLTLKAMSRFSFSLAPGYVPAPQRKLVLMIPDRGCLLQAN
jgi:cytochrome P450